MFYVCLTPSVAEGIFQQLNRSLTRGHLMTATHVATLKETLQNMFEAIEKKENIAEHILKLDAIQKEVANSAPAQLRHFLERRSYTKALEYLQTGIVIDDPNRPDCEDDAHPH
jgi:hypothetical protein